MGVKLREIKHIGIKLAAFSAYLLLVFAFYAFDIPCVFRSVFGIQCPGCGMTRACLSLLHFDLKQAFAYNYMFWSVPIIFLYILFDGKLFKNKAVNTAVLVVTGIGFTALFIARLFGFLLVS